MGKFNKISADAFKTFQIGAGIVLNTFDPETATISDEAIVCATSGGINATCVPTYADLGEDVDNCPAGTKEAKYITGYECKMAFTALNATPAVMAMALGAADIAVDKITPRMEIKPGDFKDIWGVFERLDGGMVAVHLKNALSSAGLSLQTAKDAKGQLSVEIMGHFSAAAQNDVPMEFYSGEPSPAAA